MEILRRKRSRATQTGLSAGRPLLEHAFALHKAGYLTEALAVYRSAIEIDPLCDATHNLVGALHCARGDLTEGEECFRRALDINPGNVAALSNLASARKDQGDLADAEALFRRALELQPDFPAAWNNLGLVYLGSGRFDDAEWCFRRALGHGAQSADAHNNLGTILRARGRLAEAEEQFRAAIAANGAHAEAWCGLGDVLPKRSALEEAEACCKRAIELRPGYPDATNNLAMIAKLRGDLEVAKSYCHEVLAVQPDHVGALNNLAGIMAKQGDYAKAESLYRHALAIDPGSSITRFNLSMVLLMLENYTEGFDLYESRFRAFPENPTLPIAITQTLLARPQWRGEPLMGKRLLVWSEQGLGDCIMMLRYLPELRARGADRIDVLCERQLERLVAATSTADEIIRLDAADVGALQFDFQCPMMSLPLAFRTTLDTIPGGAGYITVGNSMVQAWRERLGGGRPKVGVAWAGSPALGDDAKRSIPLDCFAPLLEQEGIEFVSLQKGDAANQWRAMDHRGRAPIDLCSDFLDTAALIMNLDLVISVDTAVAHLAGALGKPVWLFNRFESEWRWGRECDRSAWYFSMRIVRQHALDDWRDAVARSADELRLSRQSLEQQSVLVPSVSRRKRAGD